MVCRLYKAGAEGIDAAARLLQSGRASTLTSLTGEALAATSSKLITPFAFHSTRYKKLTDDLDDYHKWYVVVVVVASQKAVINQSDVSGRRCHLPGACCFDMPVVFSTVAYFAIATALNCLVVLPGLSGVGGILRRYAEVDPAKADRFNNAVMTFGHKSLMLSIAFGCFGAERWCWPSAWPDMMHELACAHRAGEERPLSAQELLYFCGHVGFYVAQLILPPPFLKGKELRIHVFHHVATLALFFQAMPLGFQQIIVVSQTLHDLFDPLLLLGKLSKFVNAQRASTVFFLSAMAVFFCTRIWLYAFHILWPMYAEHVDLVGGSSPSCPKPEARLAAAGVFELVFLGWGGLIMLPNTYWGYLFLKSALVFLISGDAADPRDSTCVKTRGSPQVSPPKKVE